MVLLSVNFDHTVMMRSDLSTFLPTLGLLGAVLKKIRLRTHKKHQKTQKIYSIDRWHCIVERESYPSAEQNKEKIAWEEFWGEWGHKLFIHACSYGSVDTVKFLTENLMESPLMFNR